MSGVPSLKPFLLAHFPAFIGVILAGCLGGSAAISLAAMVVAGFGAGFGGKVHAEAIDVAKGDAEARSVSLADELDTAPPEQLEP